MKKIFNNTKIAFALKSDAELKRAKFLFQIIAVGPFVRWGSAITNMALKIHLPIKNLIRYTVFDHFCGGINEEDCLPVVDKMFSKGVSAVLDYSVEGKEEEEQFDKALATTIKIIEFAKERVSIPFAVFKPTSFGRFDLYVKKSNKETLTTEELEEWNRVVARFEKACSEAFLKDVPLLIDAEESWMQDAIDELVFELMGKYNKEKAIVFNTLQMYRWDRMKYLKKIHGIAQMKGHKIGIKLVRGAYLEKENGRADRLKYPSPIFTTKLATDNNFDAGVLFIIKNIDVISVFAGTHNQESVYNLMSLMEEKGIDVNDDRIWFGQLYGMSDNISFNLASNGYQVAKYLPFGPVKEVMPYLIRRAQENTSVAGQTGRELQLIKQELQRRKEEKITMRK